MEKQTKIQKLPQNNVNSSLCICGSSEINRTLIKQDTWLGSSSSSMRRYSLHDTRFTTREYSLGFDFYAKTDLLKTNCKQCSKSDFIVV